MGRHTASAMDEVLDEASLGRRPGDSPAHVDSNDRTLRLIDPEGSPKPSLLALCVLGHVSECPQALPQRDRPAREKDRQRAADKEERHALPEGRRRKDGEDSPDHDEDDAGNPEDHQHRRP
jgi:hypothetical protein